jgi:hypothetical protein
MSTLTNAAKRGGGRCAPFSFHLLEAFHKFGLCGVPLAVHPVRLSLARAAVALEQEQEMRAAQSFGVQAPCNLAFAGTALPTVRACCEVI